MVLMNNFAPQNLAKFLSRMDPRPAGGLLVGLLRDCRSSNEQCGGYPYLHSTRIISKNSSHCTPFCRLPIRSQLQAG
jgi:hypothetical protein